MLTLTVAVSHEYPFLDKYLFYRWSEDEGVPGSLVRLPSREEQELFERELSTALYFLATVGPDALFRMVLQKPYVQEAAKQNGLQTAHALS